MEEPPVSSNEGRVYFELYGENVEPDVITARLGIEPTHIQSKGNPKPKWNSWELSTATIVDDSIDVYAMSSELVAELNQKADEIVLLKKEFHLEAVLEVVLWITMDENKSTPAIGFDHQTIQFLAHVGATIDIETYRH
jgi:hypothetical protein